MTHKSFQIRQDDEFFLRLQSKESTGSSSFRLLYYGGASGAVPFLWEIEPGTPKDIFCEDSPPPLTPPPAFQYFNPNTASIHNMKHTTRPKILDTIFPKLSLRKTYVSPSPSQSTWSWGSSNYASSSSPLRKNRSFRRSCCFLCPRLSMVFGEDDDCVASFNSRHGSLPVFFFLDRERLDVIGKKFKRETDHASSHHMGGGSRRHMLGPPGALNTITPCAACKLLRRRCAQECPFSPYFSPHEPQRFASVHKVFGASNVSKMLMEVPQSQRADVANSLVYEANVRLRDPVYGCTVAISALQQQVQSLQAELNAVRAEIMRYKYRESNLNPPHVALPYSGAVSISVPPTPTAAPSPSPPPPPLQPLPSTSSIHTQQQQQQPSTSTDYRTIPNENVSYLG
ncbi:Lateral organ boundaries, LOB [Dillenia turbinata]|uniref:Lateral organ boundaries, LOB n=1 Tax=Dillenia turbinata TaxID=194707 RepID=A0AAN8VGX6_9MAGN